MSPENSSLALDLGWLTVGTADVPDTVMHTWVVKLLISPPWGVVRYAGPVAVEAITQIAELHRAFLPGETPPIAAWDSAARSARAVSADCAGAELYALRAAHQSTALIDPDDWNTFVEVTRQAIRSWRRLAGLSVASAVPQSVSGTARRVGTAA